MVTTQSTSKDKSVVKVEDSAIMEETESILDLEDEVLYELDPDLSMHGSINHYLRKKQDFQSVNIMIQMEYCKGQSLDSYLQKRNKSREVGFWDSRKRTGLIDRAQNLAIFS